MEHRDPVDPLRVLTGATGSGKKEVGLELARNLGAEVIGLDSVKVYRGLVVGAASPTQSEVDGVRTHLVGVVDPRETFSLGRYIDEVRSTVRQIEARGKSVLFLGGTPLYLQALLRGLFRGPPADPRLRRRLVEEAERFGVEALHARLAAFDPDAAGRILKRDFKRITRALEVYELTGRPISELQRTETRRPLDREFRVVALFCAPALLRRRQAERVDRMFAEGLVEEVRRLSEQGLLIGEPARAIGYREILAHLAGELTLQAAREAMLRSTWRLTVAQRKWFRRFPELVGVERREDSTLEELLEAVRLGFLR